MLADLIMSIKRISPSSFFFLGLLTVVLSQHTAGTSKRLTSLVQKRTTNCWVLCARQQLVASNDQRWAWRMNGKKLYHSNGLNNNLTVVSCHILLVQSLTRINWYDWLHSYREYGLSWSFFPSLLKKRIFSCETLIQTEHWLELNKLNQARLIEGMTTLTSFFALLEDPKTEKTYSFINETNVKTSLRQSQQIKTVSFSCAVFISAFIIFIMWSWKTSLSSRKDREIIRRRVSGRDEQSSVVMKSPYLLTEVALIQLYFDANARKTSLISILMASSSNRK